MTEPQSAALAAIVGCGAVVMGREAFDAAAPGMAQELIDAGLLAIWEQDAKGNVLAVSFVTLTPLAAELLRVEIVERGPNWQVWDDAGKERGPIVADRYEREYRLPFPEMVVDHRPGPAQQVEYLLDRWSGEKVLLFGRPVPVDPRLGPRRSA